MLLSDVARILARKVAKTKSFFEMYKLGYKKNDLKKFKSFVIYRGKNLSQNSS